MKIDIKKIDIGPRQRVDLGNLAPLEESMKDIGQIHSIGVRPAENDRFYLIWGRRRLAAATNLGWEYIEATVRMNLTPLEEQLIEFSEDFERKDRTWQEICLSVLKIDTVMRSQYNRGEIQNWSSRALARITGQSNMTINYMLRVASALSADPKDEEVWALEGWWPAVQLLVKRQLVEVDKEMDARRPKAVDATKLVAAQEEIPGMETASPPIPSGTDPVPHLETLIYIHGYNYDFTQEKELGRSYSIALGYRLRVDDTVPLKENMREGAHVVLWNGAVGQEFIERCSDDITLVWNLINVPENDNPSVMPFYDNTVLGAAYVIDGPSRHFNRQSGTVISAVEDAEAPDYLPQAVVEFSLRTIAEGFTLAVLIPRGVNPVHVAEMGLIPVFYEADKAKFDASVAALTKHYENNLPNCRVVLRGNN